MALVGIITSIFSVYYYLRVVYYLYMKEPAEGTVTPVAGAFATGALVISMIGILWLGMFPTYLFNIAGSAARELLRR